MKTCSLNQFMEELTPWIDRDHIRLAELREDGRFVLHFLDGMRNVYQIDDCTVDQVRQVMAQMKAKGIPVQG